MAAACPLVLNLSWPLLDEAPRDGNARPKRNKKSGKRASCWTIRPIDDFEGMGT